MSDLIGTPTVTPGPPVSNITTSELAGFDIADVKAASCGSWNMAEMIPAETQARLANMAEVLNRIDRDEA